jgi:hypothetical protein
MLLSSEPQSINLPLIDSAGGWKMKSKKKKNAMDREKH